MHIDSWYCSLRQSLAFRSFCFLHPHLKTKGKHRMDKNKTNYFEIAMFSFSINDHVIAYHLSTHRKILFAISSRHWNNKSRWSFEITNLQIKIFDFFFGYEVVARTYAWNDGRIWMKQIPNRVTFILKCRDGEIEITHVVHFSTRYTHLCLTCQ